MKLTIIKNKVNYYYRHLIRYFRFIFDKEYKKKKITKIRYKKRVGNFRGNKVKKARTRLFARDGNKCFWCGEKMKFSNATVDHIIPVSKGGSNKLNNLRLIHEKCRVVRDRFIIKGILQ